MAAPSYEEVLALKERLADLYSERHDACKRLRRLWAGHFYDDDTKGGIVSVFRDLVAGRSNVGPSLKVTRNLIQQISLKFQTYLAPLPMIRVPVDPPQSQTRRQQSNLKERTLYGTWHDSDMAYTHGSEMAWYLPLMGDCFLGVWPDLIRNIVRPLVRSPEIAYPVPSFERGVGPLGLNAVIFSWEVDEEWAERSFPEYKRAPKATPLPSRVQMIGRKPAPDTTQVTVLEYSDMRYYLLWVNGQRVRAIEHNLGFNLFDQVQFVHIPGEVMGHGAVEQIVNMNELENVTLSMLWEAMFENAYPTLVLEDPAKAPEQIARGPGSVIPLNPGGKAYWLHPPTQVLPIQLGFLQEMERGMKEGAAMPDANFGNIRSSIVTGKAVNELVGVSSGATVDMVQGNMGSALVSWNAKALYIYKTMFADETIHLTGLPPRHFFDTNPRIDRMRFKGSEIVGSLASEVVYSPSMDQHEKLVMALQALGAKLISRKHAREQIGIPDSDAMDEEIIAETVQDGVISTMLAAMEQGATAEQGAQIEKEAIGYIEGTAQGGPPLPELPQLTPDQLIAGGGNGGEPMPPGQVPPGLLPPGLPPGGAPVPAPTGQPPGGGVLPPGMPATEQSAPEEFSLDVAIGMFQTLQGVTGRVFLVGEIVESGTTDRLEVALTDLGDRDVILGAYPEIAQNVSFLRVEGEPDEQFIEVTPGQQPRLGGTEPTFAELTS